MPQRKQKKGDQQQNKKGRSCARFFGESRVRNKLRRVLKSNGPAAARKFADQHGASHILSELSKRDTKIGSLAARAVGRV